MPSGGGHGVPLEVATECPLEVAMGCPMEVTTGFPLGVARACRLEVAMEGPHLFMFSFVRVFLRWPLGAHWR